MARQKTKMLTAEKELELLGAYLDDGNIAARNELITAYMPLVTRMAKAFAQRGTSTVADLVQEGAVGLAEAIDKFKRGQGSRISTLATYYIKARLIRYAMDYGSHVRVGTNLPDKKVYMNLRRLVAEIQSKNGDRPINDADRATIAAELGVNVNVVSRMEARVFAQDVQISHTDAVSDDDGDHMITSSGIIAVEGEQILVDKENDRVSMMSKIWAIVETNYEERDLEIIAQRIQGDMTPEKYEALVSRYDISVERIRQIQRGALLKIREALQEDGVHGIRDIAI
jgi:RNA polymerase sigma-32 factor